MKLVGRWRIKKNRSEAKAAAARKVRAKNGRRNPGRDDQPPAKEQSWFGEE